MNRRGMYSIIHQIKARARLPDDSYRDILQQKWGVESSTKLTDAQLLELCEHMKAIARSYSLDMKLSSPPNKTNKKESTPQQRKVKVMWAKLTASSASLPTANLNAYVKQQFEVERLEWLNKQQLSELINDLQKQAEMHNVLAITHYRK